MNCGRHCTYEDYNNLVDTTEEYLKCLENNEPDSLTSKLNSYLEFVADFDCRQSERMRLRIKNAGEDIPLVKRIIKSEFEELSHNVLVDAREHN